MLLPFAVHAQALLVTYIRDVLEQPRAAEWFETWWTGDRGRYCLAHAQYGGSNSNMGVEVDWRDVKKLLPPSSTLSAFTGALMQFIADLSDEHFDFLEPTGGLFPSQQVLTKAVYDDMQDFHCKTLLCSCIMAWRPKNDDKTPQIFEDLVHAIDHSGCDGAPLHLKIKAYHADVAKGLKKKSALKISNVMELLMPRDWYLKSLDPGGKRPLAEVQALVSARADQYWDLCREGTTQGQFGLLDALDLYESFHMIQLHDDWDEEGFPWGCVCLRCQKWTLCEHSALIASLFRADVEVPDNLVAETPALRKKCNKLRGTAGPRRARILKMIAKEKKKSASKIGFVDEPVSPQPDPPHQAPVAPESTRDPAPVSTRDASPQPAQRYKIPSPNIPSSEDEADPKQTSSGSASQEPPRRKRAPVAPRPATQPEVLLDSDSDWLGLTTRPGRPAVPLRNSDGDAGSANLPPYLQNHTIVSTWGNRQTRYTWTLTQTGCC